MARKRTSWGGGTDGSGEWGTDDPRHVAIDRGTYRDDIPPKKRRLPQLCHSGVNPTLARRGAIGELSPGCKSAGLFEWSLEDIPEGFDGNHFFCFNCIETRFSSCGLDKLRRIVICDTSHSYELPSFTPGLVQVNDEFSGVQVACKDLVFPLSHSNSMTDVPGRPKTFPLSSAPRV
jgi:hypothetical protein